MRKGSYTVESAFLMPFIIALIMAVLYMAYFMHDKVLLSAVASEIAMDLSSAISYEEEEGVNAWKRKIADRQEDILTQKRTVQLSQEDMEIINRKCMLVRVKKGEIVIEEPGIGKRAVKEWFYGGEEAIGLQVRIKILAVYSCRGFLAAPFLSSFTKIVIDTERMAASAEEITELYSRPDCTVYDEK